jgi:trehalose 6-phosphate phosphatase
MAERLERDVDAAVGISAAALDALLLDLDGVITRTAAVHAAAWKQLFDEYATSRSARTGEAYASFDLVADYRRYVDGKPREEGVRDFLAARGISLPDGGPDDDAGAETIAGLGNRKNAYFEAALRTQGVEVYASTVALIRRARALGLKVAVVSSSRNCAAVVEAAGLTDLFDTRVDGVELARLGLAGKPAPDMFLEAARRLGVAPARAVVVEDALAGVEAGRQGGFGLVIGVDRAGQASALRRAGADRVVADLAAVHLEEGPDASVPEATP